jgi:murein DD-endopeptidase MepM/ murein hydrolase activator NlpD
MRLSTLICLIAALCAGLAACATTPREPARVENRYPTSANTRPTPPARVTPRDCGSAYTVQRGDTLSEIAVMCSVPMEELAAANSLYRPYTLNVGQVLSMPRPLMHVVQRGENLYRIGLRYGIPFQQLAGHNGISAPYNLEVGQQIRLPQGATVVNLASRDPSASSRSTASSPPPEQRRPPATSGSPRFDWPVRGSVLSSFGNKPDGGRNDGINIAARAGESVRAAAAGQVVYAGSELAGYGQLVLVRHTGGFVTAYAHNSRLLVSEGDQVSQGQVIAEAGSTGSVDRPQVHFEIRNGVNPVDPMNYLQ